MEERDEGGSKSGVFMSKLEGKSREDVMEVPAIFEIARTEEGRSKSPVGEEALGEGLRDRGLASPGESVEPVDGRRVVVFGP